MFGNADVGDLENSLPSWISEHLGSKSYMLVDITQLPSSPGEDLPSPRRSLSVDTWSLFERETNAMTQGKLDSLKESCSFLTRL